MDGRRAFKDRRLRPLTKCGVCGKKFNTPQALKSHESVHMTGGNNKLGPRIRSKPVILKRKIIDRKKKAKKLTKVEFECPQCTQIFSDYFTSFRHIQDYHCINSKGEEVLPTSPHIIRPKRIVTCILCKNRILSEPHECSGLAKQETKLDTTKDDSKSQFKCMGCDQTYSSVQLFDGHISGSHSDSVESMFFPNVEEFTVWKQQMEIHSKVKYVILNKNTNNQTYHCSFAPVHNTEKVTHFCPSSIILQEFPKGTQIHFHKEHYGHNVKEYNLPVQFKKNSVTSMMKNAENYTDITTVNTDDNDLYIQFKKLMECIVLDAAKINITTLKILLGKALEMTSVLNNYDEDEENSATTLTLTNKSMNDDQISTALESVKNPQRNKRKVKIQLEIENKKTKSDNEQLEIDNKALETENKKKNILEIENKKARAVEIENKKAKILEIESKKAKILQIENKKAKLLEIENKKVKGDTEELENDPKKAVPTSDTLEDSGLRENVLKKVIKQYPGKRTVEVDDTMSTPKLKPKVLSKDASPSSFNDSYKNFVDSNFKFIAENSAKSSRKKNIISNSELKHLITPTISSKRKAVVKTKMGQFKPSISPQSPDTRKDKPKPKEPIIKPKEPIIKPKEPIVKPKESVTKPKRSFGVVKDIEYEVKEQENDCNILILKI